MEGDLSIAMECHAGKYLHDKTVTLQERLRATAEGQCLHDAYTAPSNHRAAQGIWQEFPVILDQKILLYNSKT